MRDNLPRKLRRWWRPGRLGATTQQILTIETPGSVAVVSAMLPFRKKDSSRRGDDGRRTRRLCARCLRIRSEEHTSELQSLMRISYAVFCLKKKNTLTRNNK